MPLVRVRRSWRPASSGYSAAAARKSRALVLGPFAVHQLVDRVARRAPGAPQQPGGDGEAEQRRRRRRSPAYWSSTSAAMTDGVEQQVRLVMDVVGGDRDRAGAGDDVALVGEQREGRAIATSETPMPSSAASVSAAVDQPVDRAPADAERRQARSGRPGPARPAPRPCRGRSDGRCRRAAPRSAPRRASTRLATRSSAVSARLPSIAIEPVVHAAQALSAEQEQRHARRWPARRGSTALGSPWRGRVR